MDDSDLEEIEQGRHNLARSEWLQQQLLTVLNNPADQWIQQPLIASFACGQLLQKVLVFVLTHDATRLQWALDLLDSIRSQVSTAAAVGALPAGKKPH